MENRNFQDERSYFDLEEYRANEGFPEESDCPPLEALEENEENGDCGIDVVRLYTFGMVDIGGEG